MGRVREDPPESTAEERHRRGGRDVDPLRRVPWRAARAGQRQVEVKKKLVDASSPEELLAVGPSVARRRKDQEKEGLGSGLTGGRVWWGRDKVQFFVLLLFLVNHYTSP
jgi:hypothetical protein